MILVSGPVHGGAIDTRGFIPHGVHSTIGVLPAVAIACLQRNGPAAELANLPADGRFLIKHPTGVVETILDIDASRNVISAGTPRTARKLFDGMVFG